MSHILHSKPTPPKELQLLSILNARMNLSTTEKLNYENLQKGYLGELKLQNLLNRDNSSPYYITLFDLLFESNQTEFQIDSLVISQNSIFLLEVKNFAGDFIIEGDKWYIVNSGKEIRNPLLQLQRTEFLFKQLLQNINVTLMVKSYVVFVNEAFTLYQTPLAMPLIFPTQLKRFIQKLHSSSPKLTKHHENLAKKLSSLHVEASAHRRLPKYNVDQLQKGIVCKSCSNFFQLHTRVHLICCNCQLKEEIESAIIGNVTEFSFIFPERKITVGAIHEWCKVISKNTLRRVMAKHLTSVQNGKYSYYILNE